MNKNVDPKHWKLGVFYYNPDDPSDVVDKRNGTGTTVNFASRRGRLMILIVFVPLAVIIAALIAVGILGK